MHARKKVLLPLIAIFVVFTGGITASRSLLSKWGIDANVLLIANCLFFLVSLLTFFMQQKALTNANPNVFVRSVMGGILLKMFVCIAGVLAYKVAAGSSISKISVFAAMFLYLVYLGVEVAVVTKLTKQKNA